MQYRTMDVAQACNVTVNTVRNWCKDYGAFLSPGASGDTGHRTFTGRDLDVFRYIAQLRTEHMQRDAIVQRLGETTFAEVANAQDESAVTLAQTSPDVTTATPAVIVALDDHETRLALLERLAGKSEQNQREPVYYMAVGAIGALVFVMFLLLLFLVRHYL